MSDTASAVQTATVDLDEELRQCIQLGHDVQYVERYITVTSSSIVPSDDDGISLVRGSEVESVLNGFLRCQTCNTVYLNTHERHYQEGLKLEVDDSLVTGLDLQLHHAECRGRNGWFKGDQARVLEYPTLGKVSLLFFSRRDGRLPPIVADLSAEEAIRIGEMLLRQGYRLQNQINFGFSSNPGVRRYQPKSTV